MPTKISYSSLCLGVLFYYLEMVHEFFFRLYVQGMNREPVYQHQTVLSLVFLGYLLCLVPIFFFCLRQYINNYYRFLFYVFFPYLLSIVTWYFNIYISYDAKSLKYLGYGSKTGLWGEVLIIPYVLHGVFLIPIVAYATDFVFLRF